MGEAAMPLPPVRSVPIRLRVLRRSYRRARGIHRQRLAAQPLHQEHLSLGLAHAVPAHRPLDRLVRAAVQLIDERAVAEGVNLADRLLENLSGRIGFRGILADVRYRAMVRAQILADEGLVLKG